MRVGFTGTRRGMTEPQMEAFTGLLDDLGVTHLHHGNCVGADEQAAAIASAGDEAHVVAHPPDNQALTADGLFNHETRPPKPYLVRNRDIVDETALLIACPAEAVEQQRGGTWSTIRYARGQGKRVLVIKPDGTMEDTTCCA